MLRQGSLKRMQKWQRQAIIVMRVGASGWGKVQASGGATHVAVHAAHRSRKGTMVPPLKKVGMESMLVGTSTVKLLAAGGWMRHKCGGRSLAGAN